MDMYIYSIFFPFQESQSFYKSFSIYHVSDLQNKVILIGNAEFFPSLQKQSHMSLFSFNYCHTATANSLQSCPTLCDLIDGSPPGSPVPGILQARTLEWVAISFSNVWKWKVKVKSLSRSRLLATPWTAAYQAPLSMGFSRQEYWSGVPLPSLTAILVLFYLQKTF